MNYCIIVGSHRRESQSSKVGKFLAHHLKRVHKGCSVSMIDLRLNPLPLWTEDMWEDNTAAQKLWRPYEKKLAAADALIVISPEWNGMVPAGLKNFFLMVGDGETPIAHKPALIVAVSAGRGGAYPVVELRMSSYKNTRLVYLPEHVIVRNVEQVLNDLKPDAPEKEDAYIRKRLMHALELLGVYAKAFQQIRKSKKLGLEEYPNGM